MANKIPLRYQIVDNAPIGFREFASGETVPITHGGTGASTAQGARTNLLPSQFGNSGKALVTNGTDVSWQTISGGGGSGWDVTASTQSIQIVGPNYLQAKGQISNYGTSTSLLYYRFIYGESESVLNNATTWILCNLQQYVYESIVNLQSNTTYYVALQLKDDGKPSLDILTCNVVSALTVGDVDADSYINITGSVSGSGVTALTGGVFQENISANIVSNKVVYTGLSGLTITNSVEQEEGQTSNFEAIKLTSKMNIPSLYMSGESTTSSITVFSNTPNPIANTKKIIAKSGNAYTEVSASTVSTGTNTNPFTGYLCEFTYFNRYHNQNILANTTISDITGWTTGTSLPGTLSSSNPIVVKNRVYLLGGYTTTPVSTVYTAPINSDGTLGTWTTGTNLPVALSISQGIVTKNRVYLLGGDTGSGAISTVYTAPINSDGTLGSWTTGPSLPGPLAHSQAIVTKDRVYLLGGNAGSGAVSTVYTAPINSDGTLGTWTTGTSLPGDLLDSCAIVTKTRVYLLGGYTTTPVSTVYTAPINSDGTLGSWTTGTNLPVALRGSVATVTKGRVYLLGGHNGTSVVSTVYTAPISSEGTLGTWTTGTSLPGGFSNTNHIVTPTRIYTIGGWLGSAASSTVYTAPFPDGWEISTTTYEAKYNYSYTLSGFTPTLSQVPDIVYQGGQEDIVYASDINAGGVLVVTSSTLNDMVILSRNTLTTNHVVSCNGGVDGDYINTTFASVSGSDAYLTRLHSQNIFANTTISDITGWTTGTSLPGPVAHTQAVVTKGRVYILGGHNGSSAVSTVYTAPINSDGTLGSWTTGPSLPAARYHGQALVTNNILYYIGGSDGYSTQSSVYKATINTDGTISSWTSAPSLPIGIQDSVLITTKNRIYLLSRSSSTDIYSAPINSNGEIGTWASAGSLPAVTNWGIGLLTKSKAYIIGGASSWTSPISTVYVANLNSDGTLGTWSNANNNLPSPSAMHQLVATRDRVFIIGGGSGSSASSNVYTAPINPDGTLGGWSSATNIPSAVNNSSIIVTKNRVYLIGGYSGSGYLSTVYTASFEDGWEITTNSYLCTEYVCQTPTPSFSQAPDRAYRGSRLKPTTRTIEYSNSTRLFTNTYGSVILPTGTRSISHGINGGATEEVTAFGPDEIYL